MKAMIFAAGLGTRLRPLTDTMPKALVPLAGKPLLWHVAKKITEAGITDIVVNTHHFAGMIESYIQEQRQFGVRVSISCEAGELLETGGGILHARNLLDGCGCFLVHNVDILSDVDLRWFISMHREDALASLLVSERQSSRYLLFGDDMRLMGWTDTRTGEIKSPFPDFRPENCRRLAFSGIHCISDRVFGVMEEHGLSGRFPIMDFYLSVAAEQPVYGVKAEHLKLIDVGKTASLAEAEKLLSL